MRCAVTGANGFLGSHLVDRLLDEGHEVRILARPTADLKWIASRSITRVAGGLADGEALRETFDGSELVFHVAGLTSARSNEEFYEVNARGTRAAAEACLEAAPRCRRFVLVSSLAAVGPAPGEAAIDESAVPRPVNHYGRSKLAGELEARSFGEKLPLTIVRPGGIYGPRDKDFVPLFKLAARGLRVKVGLARRLVNLCHVADVVSGLLLSATRAAALGQVIHVGDSVNYDFAEAGRIIARALGAERALPLWLPLSVAYTAAAATGAAARLGEGRPALNLDRIRMLTARNWTMDVGQARRLLGYEPRYDLASGAAHTAAWYREVGWM